VECGPERAETLTGEVRSLPHEPATTRGFWCDQTKKSPNREWLGLWDVPADENSLAAWRYFYPLAQPISVLLQGSPDLSGECETFVVCS
jgi:hypothetical protein